MSILAYAIHLTIVYAQSNNNARNDPDKYNINTTESAKMQYQRPKLTQSTYLTPENTGINKKRTRGNVNTTQKRAGKGEQDTTWNAAQEN